MCATTLYEDVFYAHFRPFRHDKSEFDIWGGLGLETFGHDLHLIKIIQQSASGQALIAAKCQTNRLCQAFIL